MRRFGSILVVAALSASLFMLGGCQKKIDVKSGTRTVCTYGEVVSQKVKTISVPADKAGSYRVRTVTVTCDRHTRLEELYAEAQADITKGDLAAAKVKLTQVVASDKTYRSAAKQLNEIKAGKKPSPDTTTKPVVSKPTTSTPAPGSTSPTSPGAPSPSPVTPPAVQDPAPGDETPTGPIVSMLEWAPDAITGYKAAKVVADTMSLSRQYVPLAGTNTVALVIAAEQYRDAKTATAALGAYAKRPFPENSSTVTVNGHTAYFGTDSTRFAMLAFTDGAVLVQIEMAGALGKQASLKDELVAVAKQLP